MGTFCSRVMPLPMVQHVLRSALHGLLHLDVCQCAYQNLRPANMLLRISPTGTKVVVSGCSRARSLDKPYQVLATSGGSPASALSRREALPCACVGARLSRVQ